MWELLLHRIYVSALIFSATLIFLITINSSTRYSLIRQLYLWEISMMMMMMLRLLEIDVMAEIELFCSTFFFQYV